MEISVLGTIERDGRIPIIAWMAELYTTITGKMGMVGVRYDGTMEMMVVGGDASGM